MKSKFCRNSFSVCMIVFLILLISACRSANGVDSGGGGEATKSWGTAGLIETDNAGDAQWPQVAMDASGNAVAVWHQSDGTRYNIWANRYTASTHSWGTAALIETDNAGDAQFPEVAIDASGNAVAVWTYIGIWSNRYNASTGLWGTAERISDNSGRGGDPQVAMDASGNAVAVWTQSDGTNVNIWSNRYTASTGLWGAAQLIGTDNPGDADRPQVAIDASGNVVAVWEQHNDITGIDYVWSNRYIASTGLWGTAVLIWNHISACILNGFVQVAIDASGNAVAVWAYNGSIWSNRYTASTHSWGTAELIETDDAGDAPFPQIAIDASGNVVAVWHNIGIWSNRYTALTGLWGTAELIQADSSAGNPQLAIDAYGNVVVVLTKHDGTSWNILSNSYNASTGLWNTAALIETNAGDAMYPQVAIDASGNAIAVWFQYDGTRANIWANMYR